jgi:hypothetical protein
MIALAKSKTYLAAALLVLLLAALSGCGGGDKGSATDSEPLTKAQFIKRASAICQREDAAKARRLEKAAAPGKAVLNGSRGELRKLVVEVIIPLYRELISELASLEPPTKNKAQVERIVGTFEALLEEAEANPDPMIQTDPFTKADELAASYGIQNCSL